MLAVKDETCTRDVLGSEDKRLLDLLLKLIDETKDEKHIVTCITNTLTNGAQYLLPKPEERIEMLLRLLPKSASDLQKTTYGQVGFYICSFKLFKDQSLLDRICQSRWTSHILLFPLFKCHILYILITCQFFITNIFRI